MTCNNETCREAVDALREFLDAFYDMEHPGKGRGLRVRERARAVLARIDANSDEEG